ncbi:MAG: hypothetical protein JO209_04825 [Acidisphaera sp.]|nr:hypothetical protein [Acidisphaera sp.]
MAHLWPWAALTGLGAFHGINPAMGWLFAVALGLQAGNDRAVLRAIPPIGCGHAAAIALAVAIVALARPALDPILLQVLAALCLIGFGIFRLLRGYRHAFRVGMVAGFGDLVLWSFLMATAHGAGLMIAPLVLALPLAVAPVPATHAHATVMAGFGGSLDIGLLAVLVHTAAMLAMTGLLAWAVYAWVGLSVLRRGWINFDVLWSAALIGAGLVLLAVAVSEFPAPDR